MKTGKYYLGLTIIIGVLCATAAGEVELPSAESEPLLLAQPNPTMKGIRQLYIIVCSPTNAAPVSHGFVFEKLENSVKEKIEEAGITIAETDIGKLEPKSTGARMAKIIRRKPEYVNVKDLKFRDARIPELRVDVETLDIKDPQQVIFHIRTSLARLVHFGNENRLNVKTDVWQSEPIMQAVSAEGMPAAVTSAVLEQVEAFIHAHLTANPPNKRPFDSNDISIAAEEQVEPAAESTPAEYKYVASKNSKVFHKPDCHWVRQIKPENLVYYSSRDEAINAGKKPCKQCKP